MPVKVDKDLSLALQWVEEGLAFQKKYGQTSEWDKYQLLYEHNFASNVVPINKYFSICRSLVPRVYFRNPRVIITARKPDLYWQAQIVERLDNWLLVEKNFKRQIQLMIQDGFFNGIGVGIVGYDNFFAYSGESAPLESDKGEVLEHNENIKNGQPWFERIDPRDVIFPYGTKSVNDMPWFGQKVVRYTYDIKNDPRFKENAKDLKGKNMSEFVSDATTRDPANADKINQFQEQTTLWIFRDARKKKVMVMAEGHDKLLYNEDDALQIEGMPLVVINFNPTGRSIYGIPDARIISPQQNQLNDLNTLIAAHAFLSIKKWAIDQSKIKPEEWQKAMTEIVGATVNVEGSLENTIQQFSLTIPQELIQMLEIVDRAIREQVGFSRQAQGEFSPGGRKTAFEVKTVDAALAIRIDERRDAVAEALTQVVRKWNQYIFSFWNEQVYESLVGVDGVRRWVQFTGEDIRGEYGYEIDPDDAVPVTGELRKMEAMQVGTQLAQLPEINRGELIKQVMKHFSGFDVDALLRPSGVAPTPEGAVQTIGQFGQEQSVNEKAGGMADMMADMQRAQMEQNAGG